MFPNKLRSETMRLNQNERQIMTLINERIVKPIDSPSQMTNHYKKIHKALKTEKKEKKASLGKKRL